MKQMRCCGAVMPAVVSHLTCVVCAVAQASMDTSVQKAEHVISYHGRERLGICRGNAGWHAGEHLSHPHSSLRPFGVCALPTWAPVSYFQLRSRPSTSPASRAMGSTATPMVWSWFGVAAERGKH